MNHPIIANENAQIRYNDMLQQAATYRLIKRAVRRRSIMSLITAITSLFV